MSRASRRSRSTRVTPSAPASIAAEPSVVLHRAGNGEPADSPSSADPPGVLDRAGSDEPTDSPSDAEQPVPVDDRRADHEFDPADRFDIPIDLAPADPACVAPTQRRRWTAEEIDRLMAEIVAEVQRSRELRGELFPDDLDDDDDWYEDWLDELYDIDDPDEFDDCADLDRRPFDDDCPACRAIAEHAAIDRSPSTARAADLLRASPTAEDPTRLVQPTAADAEVLAAGRAPSSGGGSSTAPLGDVALPIEAGRPLTDAAAVDLIRLAMAVPAEPQTVALLFDEQRVGGIVVVVSRTVDLDAVIDVVGHLAETASTLGDVTSMVVASIRPHGRADALDDVDRWLCLDEVAEFHDLRLVEWYVFDGAGSVTRPRELTFEPSRW
jgi:hypothetical protein